MIFSGSRCQRTAFGASEPTECAHGLETKVLAAAIDFHGHIINPTRPRLLCFLYRIPTFRGYPIAAVCAILYRSPAQTENERAWWCTGKGGRTRAINKSVPEGARLTARPWRNPIEEVGSLIFPVFQVAAGPAGTGIATTRFFKFNYFSPECRRFMP